jgi:hypothetical protein
MLSQTTNNVFPRVYILFYHSMEGSRDELLKAFKVYKVDNNLIGGKVQCFTTL